MLVGTSGGSLRLALIKNLWRFARIGLTTNSEPLADLGRGSYIGAINPITMVHTI